MGVYTLFKHYPHLSAKVPRLELGLWPTPLQRLEKLSAYLNGKMVLIKRDDLSHNIYGGNKVRKLELVLAEARRRGCGEIITAGGLGSNHILATAALGRQAGLRVRGLFFCQPVTARVERNLLLDQYFGADMHFMRDYGGLVRSYLQRYLEGIFKRRKPFLLTPGGSNSLTTIGYINAALEMKDQLKEMNLPAPEAVFVAAGTGGTAAGLLAGFALGDAKDQTVLHAVRVVQPSILKKGRITKLAAAALARLAKLDGAIEPPGAEELAQQLHLEPNFLGTGYGFPTAKAKEAADLFYRLEGIELEDCYTAKAAAALLDYCRGPGAGKREAVLFVHTASAAPGRKDLVLPAYNELPEEFHWCFSKEACSRRCGLRKQNRPFCAAVQTPGWRWAAGKPEEGEDDECDCGAG